MVSSDDIDDSITSQISKKRRDAMDLLTKDELRYEINRGKDSRFCATIPYLEVRLSLLEDEERIKERSEDVGIAREAIRLSKIAIVISSVALIASIIATLF